MPSTAENQVISHVKDTIPGVAGNCTTAAAFTLAWLTTNALPWLHVLSILAGIAASVGTAIYYWRAVRDKRANTARLKQLRGRRRHAKRK